MRLNAFLLFALGALVDAASYLTKAENPIVPIEGGVLVAGKPTTIKWQPTTQGPITLQLRSGPSENLDQGIVIASNIPNTGSYTWTPPANLPSKPNYAIQISNDANPATQVNYSPQFAISGSASATSASSTSASSTTSASSSTSASSITSSSSSASSTSASSTTSTTTSGNSTASASKTASATKVPGSTGAAVKLGQGLAVVVGVGAFVAGL